MLCCAALRSRGTGVFGDDVRDTGIPSEVWRYYMLTNRPEQSDAVFLWEDFAAKANTELGNNLGNFVQRTLAFVRNAFGGVLPAYGSDAGWGTAERAFMAAVTARKERYVALLEEVKLKEALKEAMALSSDANEYMQRTQPWELAKKAPLQCRAVINILVNVVYALAVLLHPFMPSLTDKLSVQLGYLVRPGDLDEDSVAFKLVLQPGHVLGTPSPLFRRIDDAEIQGFRARFGGVEAKAKGAPFPLHVVVGRVLQARDHAEKPSSHLVLRVDVGGGAERAVVVNLKAAYSAEELSGRLVLLVLNVKEARVHGELSQALLLVAVKKKASLLRPVGGEADVRPGSRVLPVDCVAGEERVLDWRVEEKKLPLETVEGGKAAFGGLLWRTEEGVDIDNADALQGARIKAA